MRTLSFMFKSGLAALAIAAAASPAPALAGYPDKPVTMIVPYPPGGGTDSVARALAARLTERWGRTVLVQNISGADGLIGAKHVLAQPHDGYTMLFQIPQMLLWHWTMPEAKVEILKDFRMVSRINQTPMTVAVHPAFPADSMKELVQYCRAHPCSVGTATTLGTMIGKQLMEELGVDNAIYVPYRGGGPMMTDLLGRQVTLGLAAGGTALAQVRNKQLKVLAVTSKNRFKLMPDTPTLKELGYGVEMVTWYGMMVPKDTPAEAFDAIAKAVRSVSDDATLLESIEANGAEPVFDTPAEFQAEVESELKVLGPLIQKYPPTN